MRRCAVCRRKLGSEYADECKWCFGQSLGDKELILPEVRLSATERGRMRKSNVVVYDGGSDEKTS